MKKFQNKIIVVTGGASGIGLSTAELFINAGAKVIIVDVDKLVYEVANKINAIPLCLDISIEKNWQYIQNYIANNFLRLDILVNNAAINCLNNEFKHQDPEHMLLKTWKRIHQNNLDSIFLGCKYGINLMKSNSEYSAIINVASRSGKVGIPTLSAYASSKAAVRNYTKSVALYCAQKNYKIRCNSVTPAAILTKMWDHIIKEQKDYDNISSTIPLKRMGTTLDVAKAILFLSSDDAQFITGTEIIIDGGILAGSAASPSSKD